MLGKLRNFSKTKLASVLVGIIIIPFVFWGMGGIFQGGNTNNVAKIGNHSISTQNFLDHINSIGLNPELIKNNLDENIMSELLNDMLAKKFIELEINKLGISMSEENLIDLIKNNNDFLDKDKQFKRSKYEKFLLENNLNAAQFEKRLKRRQLEKILFNYYGGGLKSPNVLINSLSASNNSLIEIEYINLDKSYKKKDQFSNMDINKYLEGNSKELEREFIDFKYAEINPKNLVNSDEFNDEFFNKIDELENNLTKFTSLEELLKNYTEVKINEINNFDLSSNNKDFDYISDYVNQYDINILDKNDYFIIFKINNYEKKIPTLDKKFENEIRNILYQKEKFKFNNEILNNIRQNKFNNEDFMKFSKNIDDYKKTKLNSIRDDNIFDINSVKVLYALPEKSFTLVADEKDDVYLVKILKINKKKLDDKEIMQISNEVNEKIKNEIYSSYDIYLNNEYKVEINDNALERVNNFFK